MSVCTLVEGDLEINKPVFKVRVTWEKLITCGYFGVTVHVCVKASRTDMATDAKTGLKIAW